MLLIYFAKIGWLYRKNNWKKNWLIGWMYLWRPIINTKNISPDGEGGMPSVVVGGFYGPLTHIYSKKYKVRKKSTENSSRFRLMGAIQFEPSTSQLQEQNFSATKGARKTELWDMINFLTHLCLEFRFLKIVCKFILIRHKIYWKNT